MSPINVHANGSCQCYPYIDVFGMHANEHRLLTSSCLVHENVLPPNSVGS